MTNFIHLHTHSHYSLLDGLGKIDELLGQAKKFNQPALALTDHGVMYGAIEFYQKALALEIKPIIGTEIYLAPRKMTDKTPGVDVRPYHLILLAKDFQGYQNLMYLVTQGHLVGHYYKPRIDKELLANYAQGLIALSACLQGEIPQAILNKNLSGAQNIIKDYQKIFGEGNFYLELQPHPEIADQVLVNRHLIELSKDTKTPLVATNDIHYIHPDDKEAHEVLLAVNTGKEIDDRERLSMQVSDFSMFSPEKMAESFADVPEAIENTIKIADQCNLELTLGKAIFSAFPVPKDETSFSYLKKLCQQKFSGRFDQEDQTIKDRLAYELDVIEKTGFADYFLIVQDFVSWAKNQGIIVGPGRGSAAASIVSYILNITDIDPLKSKLVFERFLNLDRIAPPDFDLDFADDRRDEVIEYIANKYGKDHVAQIITFGTMASRGSIRDTGRALGMAYSDVDKIAKLIPFGLSLDQSVKSVGELLELYNNDAEVKKLIDMAKRLEGVARHASTHAAGIVIAKEPLVKYTPLQRATKGEEGIITQYPMFDLEAVGLIKLDILGLANLTIIKNALRIINKTKNVEIVLDQIPMDDPKTYQLLARGETTGVFQLESDGMKRYIKDLQPTNLDDIIAMVALYRPGPIELIPDYIKGKHGQRKITYLHPKLEPILKDTYGIAVFQEQVLQIAREIAGFTLGEADILRKAVGKKIRKLLLQQQRKFIDGAQKNGIKKEIAEKIFLFIEPFASYGFNRAHAACYGLIAYQTAYLKSHHPSEFMAALLSSEQTNIDKISVAITECERLKIKVLPPDVNESFVEFGVDKDTGNIRFALAAIKNVGEGAAQAIVEERQQNGLYQNLEDFSQRLTTQVLNKKIVESLGKAGALDRFGERNQMLAGVEEILKFAGKKSGGTAPQMALFGQTAEEQVGLGNIRLPMIDPASKKQRLSWEKELLGMYLTEHPLKEINHIINQKATPISDLSEEMTGHKVKVAGIITAVQKILTKAKEPMLFAWLEDLTSRTEILVFPKLLQKNNLIWQVDNIVLIEGNLNTKDGALKILADSVEELGHQTSLSMAHDSNDLTPNEQVLTVTLPKGSQKEILNQLKAVVTQFPGDVPLMLKIPLNGEYRVVKTKTKVKISPRLLYDLGQIVGQRNVKAEEGGNINSNFKPQNSK